MWLSRVIELGVDWLQDFRIQSVVLGCGILPWSLEISCWEPKPVTNQIRTRRLGEIGDSIGSNKQSLVPPLPWRVFVSLQSQQRHSFTARATQDAHCFCMHRRPRSPPFPPSRRDRSRSRSLVRLHTKISGSLKLRRNTNQRRGGRGAAQRRTRAIRHLLVALIEIARRLLEITGVADLGIGDSLRFDIDRRRIVWIGLIRQVTIFLRTSLLSCQAFKVTFQSIISGKRSQLIQTVWTIPWNYRKTFRVRRGRRDRASFYRSSIICISEGNCKAKSFYQHPKGLQFIQLFHRQKLERLKVVWWQQRRKKCLKVHLDRKLHSSIFQVPQVRQFLPTFRLPSH